VKITLNADLGGHKSGDTIDVTRGVADSLVEQGYACSAAEELVKPKRRTSPKVEKSDANDDEVTSSDSHIGMLDGGGGASQGGGLLPPDSNSG
jgi:hypothetical protein